MKQAKILIIFTFLLAFAFQVSAQDKTPKIVWKNLQEKYESFYDVKPSIVNEGVSPIFLFDPPWSVTLFRFDKQTNKWNDSSQWMCGNGIRLFWIKLKRQNEILVDFDKETWDAMTIDDYVTPKFKAAPDYDGTGTYKLRLYYQLKKNGTTLKTFSPEFTVIEKDYKK